MGSGAQGEGSAARSAAEAGRWGEVAAACDAEAFEAGTPAAASCPPALHLLGKLFAGDLPGARFLAKRLSEAGVADPELAAAHAVLQHLWARDFAAAQKTLAGTAWGAVVGPLAQALAAQLRDQVVRLVGKAYSSVRAPALLELLGGGGEEDLAALCQAQGWALEEGLVRIAAPAAAAAAGEPRKLHLSQLAKYGIGLDS